MSTGKAEVSENYFKGCSPTVLFVAGFAGLSAAAVLLVCTLFVVLDTAFFLLLPLVGLAVGGGMIHDPVYSYEKLDWGEVSGSREAAILRVGGGLAVLSSVATMLVWRSRCGVTKGIHLAAVGGVAACLSIFASTDASEPNSKLSVIRNSETAAYAANVLLAVSCCAALTSVLNSFGPVVLARITNGKPSQPKTL